MRHRTCVPASCRMVDTMMTVAAATAARSFMCACGVCNKNKMCFFYPSIHPSFCTSRLQTDTALANTPPIWRRQEQQKKKNDHTFTNHPCTVFSHIRASQQKRHHLTLARAHTYINKNCYTHTQWQDVSSETTRINSISSQSLSRSLRTRSLAAFYRFRIKCVLASFFIISPPIFVCVYYYKRDIRHIAHRDEFRIQLYRTFSV